MLWEEPLSSITVSLFRAQPVDRSRCETWWHCHGESWAIAMQAVCIELACLLASMSKLSKVGRSTLLHNKVGKHGKVIHCLLQKIPFPLPPSRSFPSLPSWIEFLVRWLEIHQLCADEDNAMAACQNTQPYTSTRTQYKAGKSVASSIFIKRQIIHSMCSVIEG